MFTFVGLTIFVVFTSKAVGFETENGLLEAKVESLQNELKGQQLITESILNQMMEYQSVIRGQGEEIQKLKAATATLAKKYLLTDNETRNQTTSIRSMSRRQFSGPVAFSLMLKQGIHGLGDGQTVKFDTVFTNIGYGYHEHTGIFQAPESGIYVFQVNLMKSEHDRNYYAILNDGKITAWLVPDGRSAGHYVTASVQVVLNLGVGSEVWLQYKGGDGIVSGGSFSTFSGFLLQ